LCANICLTEPKSHSEVVNISITESNATLEVVEETVQPVEAVHSQSSQMVELAMYDRDFASPESSSEHPRTPDSQISSNGDPQDALSFPPGYFNDPSNDIYEDNPEELNGTMLPKVLIPSDLWAEAVDQDIWHETFCVPAHMGGVLIGRLGKNVRELKNIWQAEFSLNTCPGRQDTLIFKLSCPIKHKDDVLQWVSRRFREAVPVHVRSLYASKEFFVTIRDEEYSKYLKMQSELDADYSSATGFRIQLCEPVTSGTVAVVPHSQGFARALVISVYSTWPKSVFYFLLDHGIFGVVALNKLRKISVEVDIEKDTKGDLNMAWKECKLCRMERQSDYVGFMIGDPRLWSNLIKYRKLELAARTMTAVPGVSGFFRW
uniref:Tudor domain-containing protein n=1 Tax=Echinostoma caproni TaxID=27848 RepID=A0A183A178_9TREM